MGLFVVDDLNNIKWYDSYEEQMYSGANRVAHIDIWEDYSVIVDLGDCLTKVILNKFDFVKLVVKNYFRSLLVKRKGKIYFDSK